MRALPHPPWSAPIEALIIDLDGTLVDSASDLESALTSTLADLSLPPVTRAFVLDTVGQGRKHLVARALAAVGAPAHRFEQAWERFHHHFLLTNGRHTVLYPGVLDGLQTLKGLGLPLVCLANRPGVFTRLLLTQKGLDRFFVHSFGGDSFERMKPDPLPLLEVCRLLGTEPARTLMVGDASNDVQAARAAGCPVVLVSYGYNNGRTAESAAPDAVIDRLDRLPPLLVAARQM